MSKKENFDEYIGIYVTLSQLKFVLKEAKDKGLSKSTYVRTLIAKELKKEVK